MPASVKSIGGAAFENCKYLTNVEIYGRVSVGSVAFHNCYMVNKVVFRNGVSGINETAFSLDKNPGNDGGNWKIVFDTAYSCLLYGYQYVGAEYELLNKKLIIKPNSDAIEQSNIPIGRVVQDTNIAYYEYFKDNIETLVIEEGITTINSDSFKEYTNLKNVSIPNSVQKIFGGAFENCNNLMTLSLPGYVEEIEGWAFRGAGKLNEKGPYQGNRTFGVYINGSSWKGTGHCMGSANPLTVVWDVRR